MSDYDELFDALTTEPACKTYADIAERTGWTEGKVATTLAWLRRPEVSVGQGWTVPHVSRGGSDHVYIPVLLNDDRPLTEEETTSVREGAAATLSHVASMGENEGHALGATAQYLTAEERRQVRRVIRALEGAAAMAQEAYERIVASNGQSAE